MRKRLAEHEIYVADFYEKRDRWVAAVNRLETVAEKYPGYDDDRVLFRLHDLYTAAQGPGQGQGRAPAGHHPDAGHAGRAARPVHAGNVTADADGRRGLLAVAVLGGLAAVGGILWAMLSPGCSPPPEGPSPSCWPSSAISERALAPIPVAGAEGPFQPRCLHFDRLSVDVDGEHATVVATLDARGRLGQVEVSSLGRERIHFLRQAGGWRLDGVLAPALSAALSALSLRASLLDGGSAEALSVLVETADRERVVNDPRLPPILGTAGHRWEPQAWYLRSERDGVVATEEALLHRPERPAEARAGRFRLLPSTEGGGRFVFEGGVL